MNHTVIKVVWDIGQEKPDPRKTLTLYIENVMTQEKQKMWVELAEAYRYHSNNYVILRLLQKNCKQGQYLRISCKGGNILD